MAARASRFAASLAEWDRASAKTDPPARTGDVGRRPSERFESLFEQFNASGDIKLQQVCGTNLGLSLSKKLCHLLQGDITVDSELGTGSCFTIRIPASAGAGPAEDDAHDEEVAAALASAEARSATCWPCSPSRGTC
jgi:hypothetical protein